VVELEDGRVLVPGRYSLPEVDTLLDLQLSADEREEEATIGGHIIARLGRFPRKGDRVQVGRYVATVAEVARRRVQRVELREIDEEAEGQGEASGAAETPSSAPAKSD
jgi:CBS domain containing-hemolysin-like protein